MSAAARLISGSVASWAQIAVTITAQLVLGSDISQLLVC